MTTRERTGDGGDGPVLFLEPTMGGDDEACLDHLTAGNDPTHTLSVLYRDPVERRTAALEERAAAVASGAFVCVGPTARENEYADHGAVRVVSDPADVTGVGMAVTAWLDAHADDSCSAVCLGSLSTLLQYAETERVFRYLHAVIGKCRGSGVHVHAHLDPAAHDERTVAPLAQLFERQQRVAPSDQTAAGASEQATAARPLATDGGSRVEDVPEEPGE
ncbi:MAG: hypothetical protein ABEJ40_11075 [Haloarculaceae archaeon]